MQKEYGKRAAELGLLLLLAALLAWCTALERQQQAISGELIRLHVVADDNTAEAQQAKLLVRDAVLAEARTILAGAETQQEAKALLRENLSLLARRAGEALPESGDGSQVRLTLKRELFGTRRYDNFSLPGGYYDALLVTIGSGEGRNWWCVVYPQLCTAAVTGETDTVTVMGGLSREQVAILEGETPEYRFKLRTLELLENLLGWFRGGSEGIPVSQ